MNGQVRLTFDDGPSEWTTPILDLLAQHGERAAFFLVGCRVNDHRDVVRRAHSDGHLVGNHTFMHQRLTGLDDRIVESQLRATSDVVELATGSRPYAWRAPFFATDMRVDGIAATVGLLHMGASIVPDDWRRTDPAEIAQTVLSLWRPASVVCLHDGVPPDGGSALCTPSRQPTVDAVRMILEAIG